MYFLFRINFLFTSKSFYALFKSPAEYHPEIITLVKQYILTLFYTDVHSAQ